MVVGSFTREIDLLVLGGGPAAVAAAHAGAALGLETAIAWPEIGAPHAAARRELARRLALDAWPADARADAARRAAAHVEGVLAMLERAGATVAPGVPKLEGPRDATIEGSGGGVRFHFRRLVLAPEPETPGTLEALLPPDHRPALVDGAADAALEWAAVRRAAGAPSWLAPTAQAALEAALTAPVATRLLEALHMAPAQAPTAPTVGPASELALDLAAIGLAALPPADFDPQALTCGSPRVLAAGRGVRADLSPTAAAHMGRVAALRAAGRDAWFDPTVVASGAVAGPIEIAWCGRSGAETSSDLAVHEQGDPAIDHARLVVDAATRLLVAATAVGPGAATMIAAAASVIEMGGVLDDLGGIDAAGALAALAAR